MDSLFGITFSKLWELLKNNKFSISFDKIPFLFVLLIVSIRNSYFAMKDKKLQQHDNFISKDPIFILGHWRSGTTFLHNLLIQDTQFNYPKIFEVIHPFVFLYLREKHIKNIEKQKVTNRPMDNVKNDPMSAGEEEFALAALTLKSPVVGWVFPKRYAYYEEYLDFKNIKKNELEEWKNVYINYLKKVNGKSTKRLILKSPTNTARIKILLEMFPNAKFINIHRNPFDVYKSTFKLHNTAIKSSSLQTNFKYDIHKRIITTYKRVYESYFNQVNLIPKENFIDVSFEDLENNPFKVIENIYSSLNIPDFDKMKPNLEKHLKSIGKYKKNNYTEIKEEYKKDIYNQWGKCFSEWNYI